jgi:putative acetyltransferase
MEAATTEWTIAPDDVGRADVQRLVAAHREWSLQQTPAAYSFSVAPESLVDAGITLLAARATDGALLGVGGLKELDHRHGEIKTMHTAAHARGLGVGRALLEALLAAARERQYERVSLETGTGATFLPARRLYESVGFRPGPPFAGYDNTCHNLCMTLTLSP